MTIRTATPPRLDLATAALDVPVLVPLVHDACSADPRHGPSALAALLALTAPQLQRVVAVWLAGARDLAVGDPEALLTELQLQVAAALGGCPTSDDTAVRVWLTKVSLGWLARHTASVRRAARRAGGIEVWA